MSGRLIIGDAVAELQHLEPASVDQILTSPPYFRLRDYGVTGQLGLEPTVEAWAERVATVCEAAADVLTPTGSLWLNLGDTFSTHAREGAPYKSLLLGPERVALALTARGWCLRNKIVWHKPNAMPVSVPDRLACTYEVVYVFTRSLRAYFDLHAIRVPHTSRPPRVRAVRPSGHEQWRGPNSDQPTGLEAIKAAGLRGHPLGKNPGDVWTIGTSHVRGHHATFPLPLAERAIRAGCPERRCRACRRPHTRAFDRAHGELGALSPSCACGDTSEAGVVLDPFMGSGTVGVAAEGLQRDWLGIELNPQFAHAAETRIAASSPQQRAA